MPDVKAALTRKVGPLPLYAWGGIIAAGIIVAKLVTGGGGGKSGAVTVVDAFDPDALPDGAGDGSGSGSTPMPTPELPPIGAGELVNIGGVSRVGYRFRPPLSTLLPGGGSSTGGTSRPAPTSGSSGIFSPFGARSVASPISAPSSPSGAPSLRDGLALGSPTGLYATVRDGTRTGAARRVARRSVGEIVQGATTTTRKIATRIA